MTKKAATSKNVFGFSDYKICLNHLLDASEAHDRGQKSSLARAMGCQPAYLSRALNGDGELSLEQVEAASRFFLLRPSEGKYLIALCGENRAGTQQMKEFWRKQLTEATSEHSELKGRVGLNDSLSDSEILTYYGSWHFAAIHVSTSIPALQTVGALADYLSLSESTVRSALEFLLGAGLVEKNAGRYKMSARRIHLPRKSPMVAKHHINWKLRSMEYLNGPENNALRYTGVVTISRKDGEKIKELILSSIEKTQGIVRESKEEILGCYSFEFFEVGKVKGLQ